MPLRICIVTWAHVSNNPRVTKEADALVAAGHRVRVVAHDAHLAFAARDDELVARRGWTLERLVVDRRRRGARWSALRLAQIAARAAFDAGVRNARVRDFALNPFSGALARLASSQPADLVIGHNLRALPAAARAAAATGARLGFDFEDLHFAEMPESDAFAKERALVHAVEREYIPRCDVITASSSGIAREVSREYRVSTPEVVLNTFDPVPVVDARRRVKGRRSLYWYSQVIGPQRGLEEAVAALGALGGDTEFHLRGSISDSYRSELVALAEREGVAGALVFHPPAPADDLVALAAEHDVGLALEQPLSLNRDLCVTNKILTYLAAGIAVAATDTKGQREVMERAAGAGFLYPPGDVGALAAGLRTLLDDDALAAARLASASAARAELNWAREGARLVSHLTVGADRHSEPGCPVAVGRS